ncbi:MAG TPA: protein-glutamate O-methyltransferase CheR [Gemmatimonadales bacterium]
MSAGEGNDWKLLSDLIENRFGLVFDGGRRDILDSRLRARMRALGLGTLREYYLYLRAHADREAELSRLASLITNNETYFFRETHQFDILVRHVLPPLKAGLKERPLKILCAGCSSGEEAYSLVIALQNAGLETAGISWEIDAHDVDSEQIARGREAVYDQSSLRACDPESRRRYFTPVAGRYRLKERHRQGVRFFETNLLAPRVPLSRAMFDVVLCRNMLIYFAQSAFNIIIDRFAQSLRPGGYLMLGHSESLLDRKTAFVPVLLDGSVVYRKLPAAA